MTSKASGDRRFGARRMLLSHLTFEVLESVPSIVIARVNELASSTLLPVVNVFYEKQNLRLREVLAVRLERITMVLE